MDMSTEIAIIVGAVVAVLMAGLLVFIVVRRLRAAKADGHQNPNAVAFTSMDGLHEAQSHKKIPVGGAELDRAQKFRERARQTTIGQPEFRVSKKYDKAELYKTLGTHPDMLLDTLPEKNKNTLSIDSRRVSEDHTSRCNSHMDTADEEAQQQTLQRDKLFDTQPLTPQSSDEGGVARTFFVDSEQRLVEEEAAVSRGMAMV